MFLAVVFSPVVGHVGMNPALLHDATTVNVKDTDAVQNQITTEEKTLESPTIGSLMVILASEQDATIVQELTNVVTFTSSASKGVANEGMNLKSIVVSDDVQLMASLFATTLNQSEMKSGSNVPIFINAMNSQMLFSDMQIGLTESRLVEMLLPEMEVLTDFENFYSPLPSAPILESEVIKIPNSVDFLNNATVNMSDYYMDAESFTANLNPLNVESSFLTTNILSENAIITESGNFNRTARSHPTLENSRCEGKSIKLVVEREVIKIPTSVFSLENATVTNAQLDNIHLAKNEPTPLMSTQTTNADVACCQGK